MGYRHGGEKHKGFSGPIVDARTTSMGEKRQQTDLVLFDDFFAFVLHRAHDDFLAQMRAHSSFLFA
jgi:hypothetical protein